MCKEHKEQKPDAVGVAVEPEVRLCEVCENPIKWHSDFGGWIHVGPIYSHLAKFKEEMIKEKNSMLNETTKVERNYKEDYEGLKNDLEIFAENLSNEIGKAEEELKNAIYHENHLHCILLLQKKELLHHITLKLGVLTRCA